MRYDYFLISRNGHSPALASPVDIGHAAPGGRPLNVVLAAPALAVLGDRVAPIHLRQKVGERDLPLCCVVPEHLVQLRPAKSARISCWQNP